MRRDYKIFSAIELTIYNRGIHGYSELLFLHFHIQTSFIVGIQQEMAWMSSVLQQVQPHSWERKRYDHLQVRESPTWKKKKKQKQKLKLRDY